MFQYIIKRILWLIPIMLGVLIIVFALQSITPGDPIDSLLGESATEEQRTALREELGLDKSIPEQFVIYVKGVVQGDLGTSYITKAPVMDELLQRLPVTMTICFGAVFLGVLMGVPMGVISAQKQYSWVDSTMLVLSMFFRSVPGFCLALCFIILFSVQLGWLPAVGISGPSSYIMPMLAIGVGSMANYTRITRTSMLEVIRQDYVRTARAKGQSERMITWSHEMRNAAIPIAATIGNQLGVQLGGALIIETVFAIPGIGKYIGDAVSARNYPAIQGGVVFLAFMFCIVNLVVDVSFTLINPRLKSTIIGNQKPSKFGTWIKGLFAKKKEEVTAHA
ncbi:MAG: ABC transporter permease [Faecalibacterium sp.]